jgi:3-oxoacyl-[acyl-carrier-protein] synthase I
VDKSVIIEKKEIISALGSLNESVASILGGKSAVKAGPSFGYPVAHASFDDLSLRDPDIAIRRLFASIDLSSIDPSRTVFIYCSAKGDLQAIDKDEKNDTDTHQALLDYQARRAVSLIGFTPAAIRTVSCACASGAIAMELAKEYLDRELFATAIIAGFDVQSRFVTAGFQALNALSPEGARPFDKKRNGLTLGDGAAAAVLARRRASTGDIIVAGAGSSNDANHRTGPSRTGEGLYRAAAAALDNAGLDNDSVGAVKCHGTATAYNDAMEAKAIFRLFPSHIPPCFSLKGAIGHTSGAGSLLEILLTSEFLKCKTAPPTAGFAEIGVDEPIPVSAKPQQVKESAILCLSAGFGGINAAVAIRELR